MNLVGDRFVLDDAKPREGGMSLIHRAVDTKNDLQIVAVKVFTSERLRDDQRLRESFNREVHALKRLTHRNIVKLVEFEPRTNPPYLVLEWVERDLETFLLGTTFEGWHDFYSRIGRPVLDALCHAATKRFEHRDLKPANVLIDNDDVPKLADFGLAKYHDYGPVGLTLGGFKSEPYAPFGDEPFAKTRDAYSFAVLALRCLAESHFTTHQQVFDALERFAGPVGLKNVFARALNEDPNRRFESVFQLQDAIDNIDAAVRTAQPAHRVCHIVWFGNALARLGRELGESSEDRILRVLMADLEDGCAFFTWRNKETGLKERRRFLLRTRRFGLRVAISEQSGSCLVIQEAWTDDSESFDLQRERGLRPRLRFRRGRPGVGSNGEEVIRWLVEAVNQQELEEADAERRREEEQLFTSWASTLRYRQFAEGRRHAPIPYAGYRVDENRVTFVVGAMPAGVALDQARWIRGADQRSLLKGVVDRVTADRVVLWCDEVRFESLPDHGQLLIDDRATRKAIDKQKNALEAVRYERAVRPDLRGLLLEPGRAREPKSVPTRNWVHEKFDEDKRLAVEAALGTEDILVVEGPPGTGKTVFIAELICQLLNGDPGCSVLLTSQTHVALDNALERLHSLRPDARLLRVARDDQRVSPSVRHLTIDRMSEKWRREVADASQGFLVSLADELGVSRDDIALGIAAGHLRAESEELDAIEEGLAACEIAETAAEQELATVEITRSADTHADAAERLDTIQGELRELRERRKKVGARRRSAAKRLSAIGDIGAQLALAHTRELAEWETSLLQGSEAARKLHNLIRLSEEWQLRFSRSREFHSAMVAEASVVAGTCLGFASVPGMLSVEFDICIVDEASKATPTELLVPLSRARKWILVGDPKQLPPFVEDLLDDPEHLRKEELDREILQQTLLDHFLEHLPNRCRASLKTQHRMVRAIGDMISECFYEGALKSVRDTPDETLAILMPRPVTWLTTARLTNRRETEFNKTYKNVAEAQAIVAWLRRLDFIAKNKNTTYTVGVVTGYVGQATELTRAIAGIQGQLSMLVIECETVDAFQGREVDICVYSVTRCNDKGVIGFLRDERRMNVALSRGKHGLLIVGDHVFCRSANDPNPLKTVIEYIDDHPVDCAIQDAVL